MRGGERIAVAGDDLVPGDIVLLDAGDKVPADLRLDRGRRGFARGRSHADGAKSVPVRQETQQSVEAAGIAGRQALDGVQTKKRHHGDRGHGAWRCDGDQPQIMGKLTDNQGASAP